MTDAATLSGIDLSRLPAPDVIAPLSYETIFAEMLAELLVFVPDFDASLESDPAVRILQVAAYRVLLERQRANDTARAVMVAYAQGADLDHLGALFRVARLELVAADAVAGTAAIMESDDDYRRRIVLAPEGYSVAGPSGAYLFHAQSADGDVLDASAISPDPAVVDVYVLSRTGTGAASPELLATVEAALSDETVRPVADRVSVHAATIVTYAIEAVITTFPGPDASLVLGEAQARAQAYAADQKRLGRDITRSGIDAALHIAGVQNVELITPAYDIEVWANEAAHCTAITLSVEGTGL